MKKLIGLLDETCDMAVKALKKTGDHKAVFLKGFLTVDVVEDFIEDPDFHEYIRQFRKRGYGLICTVKDHGDDALYVEVWFDNRGLGRILPYKKVNDRIRLKKTKHDYRILSDRDALSRVS